jgi:hypothetical protein
VAELATRSTEERRWTSWNTSAISIGLTPTQQSRNHPLTRHCPAESREKQQERTAALVIRYRRMWRAALRLMDVPRRTEAKTFSSSSLTTKTKRFDVGVSPGVAAICAWRMDAAPPHRCCGSHITGHRQ